MPTITRRELALVLLWSVAIMGLTAVPYHMASRWAGPQREFSGFIWGVDDGNVYLSWVRQAAQGRVLLRDQYTTKDQNPRFVNVFLLALGRVCRITGISPRAAFTGARYPCGVFCLLAFYLLAAQLTASVRARWWALALASLSSGLGWAVVSAGQHGRLLPGLSAFPMDVADGWQAQPEAILFSSLLLNPLFAFSLGLVCLTMAGVCRLCDAEVPRRVVVGVGLLLLLIGNVHGYDIFPIHAALVVWLGLGRLLQRISLRQAAGRYVAILALSVASPLWGYLGAKADPSYAAKVNTATVTPRPFDVAVGYGLVLALAVVGAWVVVNAGQADRRLNQRFLWASLGLGVLGLIAQQLGAPEAVLKAPALALLVLVAGALGSRRTADEAQWRGLFPILWAASAAAVLYLPVPFQRKMMEGLHIPLCILGGTALASVVGSRRDATCRVRPDAAIEATSRVPTPALSPGTRIFIALALLLATVPSNFTLVSECLRHTRDNGRSLIGVRTPPSYLSRAEVDAMRWLGGRATEDDVVLSSSLTGNHLPAYAACRVWVGHWAETLDFARCLGIAEQFYAPGTSRQTREAILNTAQPTYVWYGPQERLLQEATGGVATDPCAGLAGLVRVAGNDGVALYRVTAAAAVGGGSMR